MIKCFYRSKSFDEKGKPIGGYRNIIFRKWRESGILESTEQHVYDQARALVKNDKLSEVELEAIKRQIEDESQGELCTEQDVAVEAETVETNIGAVEDEINDAGDGFGDTEADLSEEHHAIVKQLKKIMVEETTGDAIMCKKVEIELLKRSSI